MQSTTKVKIEHKLERYGNERGWNGGEKREEKSLSRERGSEREGRATCGSVDGGERVEGWMVGRERREMRGEGMTTE